MTTDTHAHYHLTARAILRAVRHVSRGESPEVVMAVAPAESNHWRRMHPGLFLKLIEQERKEFARA